MPSKQEEIEKAVKTCIAIETSCGEFDGNRLTKNILRVENELGVVIKVDRELPNVTTTDSPHYRTEAFEHGVRDYKEAVRNASYVATIPLIKEEKNELARVA